MAMKVSIVLATFNGGKYIADQLNTILAQTRPASELIVTDDGSTDGTLGLVQSFAKKAPFEVRILEGQEHVGWADNFVRGLSQVRHELVAFCDQDDIWRPNKLELQVAAMERDDRVAMVTHCWRQMCSKGGEKVDCGGLDGMSRVARWDAGKLAPYGGTPGMSMLFRSDVARRVVELWPKQNVELVRRNGFWIFAHDLFAADVAVTLGDILVLDQPLVEYRQHYENVFNKHGKDAVVVNWGKSHGGICAWGEVALRYNCWASIYQDVAASCGGNMEKVAFMQRAGRSLERASAFEKRIALYSGESFAKRWAEFLGLLRGGYSDMSKSGWGLVAACVRDFAALIGWR